LKGAAHGEALVNAPADPVAAKRIERGNAKAAASLLFDVRKVCCQHIGQSGPCCLHAGCAIAYAHRTYAHGESTPRDHVASDALE